jgi:hypothetical protein
MSKEKYVDESWKEQAMQEKDVLAKEPQQNTSQGQVSPNDTSAEALNQDTGPSQSAQKDADVEQAQGIEVNFLNYVTSLGFQAMIFMGEIPNPITNEVDKNLGQAKFLIDTLSMLKEKTAGNLNDQEHMLLENSVYELQTKYIQISSDPASTKEGQA